MDVKTTWCAYWDGVRERGKFLKFFYAGEAQFLVEINIYDCGPEEGGEGWIASIIKSCRSFKDLIVFFFYALQKSTLRSRRG